MALFVGWLSGAVGIRAEEPPMGMRLTNSVAGALRHELEQVSAPAGPGLSLTRQPRWWPKDKFLIVENELVNTGATAVHPGAIRLLELALRRRDAGVQQPGTPLKYSLEQWYGSTFWTGPDWTRVGKDWQHPGESTPSVRCFCAPRDGRIAIKGRAYKLHRDGDGVRLLIRHGEREVWRAEIEGQDGTGVEPQLSFEVKRGDRVRFLVHKRGHIACDTTYWNPTVAYEGGEGFLASEGFSTQQGAGNWFYELAGAPPPPPPVPVLRALGEDFSLREWPLVEGQAVDLDYRQNVAWFVMDEGQSGPGAVLGLDAVEPWTFHVENSTNGWLRVTLEVAATQPAKPLAPGAKVKLPTVIFAPHEGPWTQSAALLKRLAGEPGDAMNLSHLRARLVAAAQRATAECERTPDLDLLLLVQAEWRRDDHLSETVDAYVAATADHLARAGKMLTDLSADLPAGSLATSRRRLDALSARARPREQPLEAWRANYLATRLLKRELALRNPLLNFERLLLCQRVSPSYGHLVGQYFGWRQRPGGGLFILERPGYSTQRRDLLGQSLPAGDFLEPRLSYDATRVAFSFVACPPEAPNSTLLPVNEDGPDERYFHIYEARLDGTGLRQLTRGPYDDLMPCYLPDDRLVFCSTRRRGYSRCFGPDFSRRWHSYTLHGMDADGGNLRCLSFNDVNEWFPAVAASGQILFARWDYIDRDAVTHQNLWAIRPDGSNPIAVWGNASPKPHCMFQAKPVPGSRKIVFIASAHHAITAGPVCLLDPTLDPNRLEAVSRVTPGPFPEAEDMRIDEYYESPWPLSEKHFLVAYSPERLRFEAEHINQPNPDNALGIYLIDAAGNRELIYRDPLISSTSPIPIAPQPRPPTLASTLEANSSAEGEMMVTDVYQGLDGIPRGSVKALRILQIFPKSTWLANDPQIGCAGEENARAILGTVPVEADGSARFLVPARKPILFQALDQDGYALQTMRSLTYVQPGERTACIGCHEHRMTAPAPGAGLALRRPPSRIAPGELGGRPFSYVEVVQPVLDQHCVRCHGAEKTEAGVDLTGKPLKGFTRSYWALCGRPEAPARLTKGPDKGTPIVPRFTQRNQIQRTPPGGGNGALGSGLLKLLRAGHPETNLDDNARRRLAAWVDCNAVFYGAYDPTDRARQLAGERLAMPERQ